MKVMAAVKKGYLGGHTNWSAECVEQWRDNMVEDLKVQALCAKGQRSALTAMRWVGNGA